MTTITFKYLNHRGVTTERTVDVDSVEFLHNPGFNYQPGWFISGRCHTKNARRSFALNRIELPDDGRTYHLFRLPKEGSK